MTSNSINRFGKSGVGARVRRHRQLHHVKQRDIARQIGCSSVTLWHLERGESTLFSSPEDLAAIATSCGVHPLEIIAGLPKEACEIAYLAAELPPDQRRSAVELFKKCLELANMASGLRGPKGLTTEWSPANVIALRLSGKR